MRSPHSISGPILAALVLSILLGLTPLAQAEVLPSKAIWTLGFGLATTYLSIGILVALLPSPSSVNTSRFFGFLFGFAVGFAYSIPGGFFTMVPYPLANDAASYWREFADGGLRAFLLTVVFGGLIGGISGLCRKPFDRSPENPPDPPANISPQRGSSV